MATEKPQPCCLNLQASTEMALGIQTHQQVRIPKMFGEAPKYVGLNIVFYFNIERLISRALKERTSWPWILSLALGKHVETACCIITDQTFPYAVNTCTKGTRQLTRIKSFILFFNDLVRNVFFPSCHSTKAHFQLIIPKTDGFILFGTLVFLVSKCSTLTDCHSAKAVAPTK